MKMRDKENFKRWQKQYVKQARLNCQKYEEVHKAERKNKKHLHYLANKKEITEKNLAYHNDNRKYFNIYARLRFQRLKYIVIEHYSNGRNKCNCCGENIADFLTIDHINGGGNAHKERIGTHQLYPWLIKNNFPKGYQILCYNCNCGKNITHDKCPHKLTNSFKERLEKEFIKAGPTLNRKKKTVLRCGKRD